MNEFNIISRFRKFFFEFRSLNWARNEYFFEINRKWKKKVTTKKEVSSILHINTTDSTGGAAKIANDLFLKQRKLGIDSKMLVALKKTKNEEIFEIPLNTSKKQHFLKFAQDKLQWQDFFHLSSKDILECEIFKTSDIIHLHNLHGGYFSPFAVYLFGQEKPVVWSLHDMQSFTGHCAHAFDCEKWKTGCGECPQLSAYPSISIDTSDFIWKTRQKIYSKSNLHIVVLSNWLREKVEKSILSNQHIYTIHNGIDTSIYTKVDKVKAREKLNIPLESKVVLFSADMGTQNPYKGGAFVTEIIEKCNEIDVLFINIGGKKDIIKTSTNWEIPYVLDPHEMAQYYSAADLYLYPTLADNCPLVVLEAMSCGLPVLTFETGGVPELVSHMNTGYIADYKSFEDLNKGFKLLLENEKLRVEMGQNGIKRVNENFTIEIMNEKYMKIYSQITKSNY